MKVSADLNIASLNTLICAEVMLFKYPFSLCKQVKAWDLGHVPPNVTSKVIAEIGLMLVSFYIKMDQYV